MSATIFCNSLLDSVPDAWGLPAKAGKPRLKADDKIGRNMVWLSIFIESLAALCRHF